MKDAAKKEEASKKVEELKAQKADMDAKIVGLRAQAVEQETAMRRKGNTIGNIVHESVPVSDNEVSANAPPTASFR